MDRDAAIAEVSDLKEATSLFGHIGLRTKAASEAKGRFKDMTKPRSASPSNASTPSPLLQRESTSESLYDPSGIALSGDSSMVAAPQT